MKSRSNACLTASLPSIANQTNLGRQLTVRCIEKQGPPVGTTQTANSLLHDSPLSPTNSVLLDSSTSYSTFQQMMRERPKSAAPYVKSLLPVPIMTSKSPLPMPKITGSLNNSSFSSLPVQQNSPSSNITTPFLLDIAPPVQEESLNDFQTQTNDIFSSWDLNFGLFGNSSPSTPPSQKSSSISERVSSNNSEMQDSVFPYDQLSMDLPPFDDTNFTSLQDTNCTLINDNWYQEEGVAFWI